MSETPKFPSVLDSVPESDRELHLQYRLRLTEHIWKFSLDFRQSANQHGQNATRAAFLANGGAMIAVLAFLGNLYSKQESSAAPIAAAMYWPCTLFASGLFASMLASGLAYVNFYIHASALNKLDKVRDYVLYDKELGPLYGFWQKVGVRSTTLLAMLAVLGAMICFVLGTSSVSSAIAGSKPAAPLSRANDSCRAVLGMDGKHYHLLFCPLDVDEVTSSGPVRGSTNGP